MNLCRWNGTSRGLWKSQCRELAAAMWVPRTPEENEKTLRKEALRAAVAITGLMLVLEVFSIKTGWHSTGWPPPSEPISWSGLLSRTPLLAGVSVVVFVCVYLFHKGNNRSIRSRAFVCLQCGKEFNDSRMPHCKCGGLCVDLNHAKWVDEKSVTEKLKPGHQ
jgi:hypothetical protein